MFRKHSSSPVRCYRPTLEMLEVRALLSTFTVDRLTDHNPNGGGEGSNQAGDLRYCIWNAANGDHIAFGAGVTGFINPAAALPALAHSVSIDGPGPVMLIVRAGFTVDAGTVSISGLTITSGNADYGGGISNYGQLTVSNCTISHNSAGEGGGIFNSYGATLTISNSTIAGNEAFNSYGVGLGGGIYNRGGTLTISNSTIFANTGFGGFEGGGVGGIYNSYDATLTVSNSTISGNSGDLNGCGGIESDGTLNMRNSVLAGNIDDYEDQDLEGHLTSSGYNLIGFGGDGFVNTDIVNVENPLLSPLQNNGGSTLTQAPRAGSRALNAGDPAQLGIPDQRGVVRKGGVNIGAYQASASAFFLTAPDTVTSGTAFDVTVNAVDVFGQPAYGYTGTVTFSTSDRDPNVVLPADYTFIASDQGAHTFSGGFTLITPGDQTITATDTADNTIVGSATVTVTGGGDAPGSDRGADSADAFFALLDPKWSRPRHQNGDLAFWDGWTSTS
jgi:hypothetical protein